MKVVKFKAGTSKEITPDEFLLALVKIRNDFTGFNDSDETWRRCKNEFRQVIENYYQVGGIDLLPIVYPETEPDYTAKFIL